MISAAKVLESDLALLEFTSVPAVPTPAPSARAAVRAIPRRLPMDWYTLGVILLIHASGAVCLYRLAWAMQP